MKIAVFSDIHGNLEALKSIINDIKKNDFDKTICLGDVISLGPKSRDCLDLIIKNKIEMVLGNHELYYLKGPEIDDEIDKEEIKHYRWVKSQLTNDQKEFISKLPMAINYEVGNKKILFEHFPILKNTIDDYPFEDLNIINDNSINKILDNLEYDYMFIGHEHNQMEFNSSNKKLIVVGSSGCLVNQTTFYTIINIEDDNIVVTKKLLEYNRNQFINDVLNYDYPCRDIIKQIFFGIN